MQAVAGALGEVHTNTLLHISPVCSKQACLARLVACRARTTVRRLAQAISKRGTNASRFQWLPGCLDQALEVFRACVQLLASLAQQAGRTKTHASPLLHRPHVHRRTLCTDCTRGGKLHLAAPPSNMRAGFLGQQGASKPRVPAREDSAHDAAGGAKGGGAPQRGAAATSEALAAGLAECLQLLQGPTDERRCVYWRQCVCPWWCSWYLAGVGSNTASDTATKQAGKEGGTTSRRVEANAPPASPASPGLVAGLWACCW